MNVKESLDLLMLRLGNRTAPTLRAQCLSEMKLIQQTDLEGMEELPWFIISEEATTVTAVLDERIELPSDFIREVEDDDLYWIQDDGTRVLIPKRGYDEGRFEIDDNAEPGPPELYSVRGNYIILRPKPDLEYTIEYPSYYARQESPVDSITSENQWFKWVADLLIAKAGVIISGENLKDEGLVTLFGGQQQRAMQRLANMITAREEANRNRRMG